MSRSAMCRVGFCLPGAILAIGCGSDTSTPSVPGHEDLPGAAQVLIHDRVLSIPDFREGVDVSLAVGRDGTALALWYQNARRGPWWSSWNRSSGWTAADALIFPRQVEFVKRPIAWADDEGLTVILSSSADEYYLRRYRFGQGWSEIPMHERAAGEHPMGYAAGPHGAVVALDIVNEHPGQADTRFNLVARRYDPVTGWSALEQLAQSVSTESSRFASQHAAISVDGSIWASWEPSEGVPVFSRFVSGAGWSAPASSGFERGTLPGEMRADGVGGVMAFSHKYAQPGGDLSGTLTVRRAYFRPKRAESPAISDFQIKASTPFVWAIGKSGAAAVTWNDPESGRLHVDYFAPTSGWQTLEPPIPERAATATIPVVTVDARGRIILAWHGDVPIGPNTNTVFGFYARYTPGTGWTPPRRIGADAVDSSSVMALGVNEEGDVMLLWQQSDSKANGTYWSAPLTFSDSSSSN